MAGARAGDAGERVADPLLSIVVRVLDEAACISELVRRVREAARAAHTRYEILLLDDGSCDATPDRIGAERAVDPRVKTIRFTRTFGHQAALCAGLRHARGDAVVTMDGDLQHPPECIPELVERWRAGADVVQTVRRDPPGRRRSLAERSVFVRGLVPWLGFPEARVEYEIADRYAGERKYSPAQMRRLAVDGIFSFSVVPLRLISLLGLATTLFGLAYGVFSVVSGFMGRVEGAGWPSLVVLILIFGGVQLLSLGIVSEYIARIYEETKRRPRYVIESPKRCKEGTAIWGCSDCGLRWWRPPEGFRPASTCDAGYFEGPGLARGYADYAGLAGSLYRSFARCLRAMPRETPRPRLLEGAGFELESMRSEAAWYTAGYLAERLRKTLLGRPAGCAARWPGAGLELPLNLFDIVKVTARASG